ncbi:hypothetical protein [Rhizobium leguminosarum]
MQFLHQQGKIQPRRTSANTNDTHCRSLLARGITATTNLF